MSPFFLAQIEEVELTETSTAVDPPSSTEIVAPSEEFVNLFTKTQRKLYLYILSQVGSPDVAEEILQNTNLVIWSKYHQFEIGTNFQAWSCQIATYEVLKYRQQLSRSKIQFSDEFVSQVASASEEALYFSDEERAALQNCLEKLRKKDRELIQQRYKPGSKAKDLADQIGRPANSVYQSLGRIRRTLLECVRRQTVREARI